MSASLIRLASSLPVGSPERKSLLKFITAGSAFYADQTLNENILVFTPKSVFTKVEEEIRAYLSEELSGLVRGRGSVESGLDDISVIVLENGSQVGSLSVQVIVYKDYTHVNWTGGKKGKKISERENFFNLKNTPESIATVILRSLRGFDF